MYIVIIFNKCGGARHKKVWFCLIFASAARPKMGGGSTILEVELSSLNLGTLCTLSVALSVRKIFNFPLILVFVFSLKKSLCSCFATGVRCIYCTSRELPARSKMRRAPLPCHPHIPRLCDRRGASWACRPLLTPSASRNKARNSPARLSEGKASGRAIEPRLLRQRDLS